MDSITLCKENEINNISDLAEYIIELDIAVSVSKKDVKVDNNFDNLENLRNDINKVKILQGHFNSLIAKREYLSKKFGEVIARNLVNQLVASNKAYKRDIVEYGDINLVNTKGGFYLKYKNYQAVYVKIDYRETKLYKMIKC